MGKSIRRKVRKNTRKRIRKTYRAKKSIKRRRYRGGATLSPEDQIRLDGKLYDAADKGDVAAIKRLVGEGASLNAKNKYGTPVVWWAASQGHAHAVEELLTRGADINAKAHSSLTALMIAAAKGHMEVVRVLLAHGADRTIQGERGIYEGQTALTMAEKRGHAEVVALLREESGGNQLMRMGAGALAVVVLGVVAAIWIGQ